MVVLDFHPKEPNLPEFHLGAVNVTLGGGEVKVNWIMLLPVYHFSIIIPLLSLRPSSLPELLPCLLPALTGSIPPPWDPAAGGLFLSQGLSSWQFLFQNAFPPPFCGIGSSPLGLREPCPDQLSRTAPLLPVLQPFLSPFT